METQIELKPFTDKKGKYKIIQITDLTLHTANKKPTSSLGKTFRKSFKKNAPGRIYSNIKDPNKGKSNNSFNVELFKIDNEFMKMVQEEEAKGYKIVLAFPKSGIPVFAGKDTMEFMDSKNGKRIIRGLAKKK